MASRIVVSRRQFLEVVALAGGGLMLGLRMGQSQAVEPAAGTFAPNAWIRIQPNGAVTLICGRNEMGQDVHTSLALLLAEEMAVDPRRVRIEQAPVDPVYLNRMLGAQITGGSTSVRDAWEPLRRAGAVTRKLMVTAAAETWNVPEAECRAGDGAVTHGKKTLGYGSLAAHVARIPVPNDVILKSPGDFTLIGKWGPRLDGADKARGRTVFGIDVKRPDMVYAALTACPVLGGEVASFDADAARKRHGVHRVVNLGEGIGVIADHYWTARTALAEVKIQWDEGQAAKLDTAAIRASLEQAASRPGVVVRQAGDAQAALSKGKLIETRYTSQMLAHGTLEPQNCMAMVSPTGVDVWVSTQFPQGAQAAAAKAAGVPTQQVRIHPQFIGGGFGRRLDVDFVPQAVALAKTMPGTPVKLIWSREEDTAHDFYRPPSLHLMRATLQDGRVSALGVKMISPSITNRLFPGVVKNDNDGFMTEGLVDFTYDVPDLELRTVIQEVGIRVGFWRSVSYALNAFAIESFVDELAHAAGRDPVAFRLAMLQNHPRQRAVLERAVAESGFKQRAGGARAFGVATMECYESHLALVAEVSGTADKIRLERLTYVVDCGIAVHPDQVVAQLEGGAVTGIINAIRCKVTVKNGRVEQSNFHDFPLPRMAEVPPVKVIRLPGTDKPGGIGETGVPLVAPALANAVFALTGKRIRSLPLEDGGVHFV
ncbi:aldehyde oxidase [Cupriavidus sp. SK-3]|uniref:xanthine dehydrogenase family protein molybdopterin-binding subunit n=1 Tax=Cupriavidus sp. SK-3 TaxID=1470558 RepID=UPI00044BAD88|nr:molybdopterin cofactor-binding domain-containing protein [Cupriavidus sp. SK-3]KDP89502.1 aldehyde oxidase [Cupriavidus sp. SK-3]